MQELDITQNVRMMGDSYGLHRNRLHTYMIIAKATLDSRKTVLGDQQSKTESEKFFIEFCMGVISERRRWMADTKTKVQTVVNELQSQFEIAEA